MNNWAIQWKMGFNLDPSKQAPEVIFSRKLQKTNHTSLFQSQLRSTTFECILILN